MKLKYQDFIESYQKTNPDKFTLPKLDQLYCQCVKQWAVDNHYMVHFSDDYLVDKDQSVGFITLERIE